MHTCTLGYCQKKYWDIQQHIIVLRYYIPVHYDIVRGNTNISSSILLSSIYTNLYTMKLSEETLRYPASYYFPSPLILYNMILSDETLKYPAACYFSPLIHTCTISILPLDEGVNHPNTFIQEQYVFYYTEA